jgi:hypothetical protein
MTWSFMVPATRPDEFVNALDQQVSDWRKNEKPDRPLARQVDAGVSAAKALVRSNALGTPMVDAVVAGSADGIKVMISTGSRPRLNVTVEPEAEAKPKRGR